MTARTLPIVILLLLPGGNGLAWEPDFCGRPKLPLEKIPPTALRSLEDRAKDKLLAMLGRSGVVQSRENQALIAALAKGTVRLSLWGPIESWDDFGSDQPSYLLRAIQGSGEELARFQVEKDGYVSRSWFVPSAEVQHFQGILRDTALEPNTVLEQARQEFGLEGHSPQAIYTVGQGIDCSFPKPCTAFQLAEGVVIMRGGREPWIYQISFRNTSGGDPPRQAGEILVRAACRQIPAVPLLRRPREQR